MQNPEHQLFACHDLGLCASLRALGVPMIEMRRSDGKRFAFVFEGGENVAAFERAYWSGNLPVDALTLFNAIKVMKSLIHSQT